MKRITWSRNLIIFFWQEIIILKHEYACTIIFGKTFFTLNDLVQKQSASFAKL